MFDRSLTLISIFKYNAHVPDDGLQLQMESHLSIHLWLV